MCITEYNEELHISNEKQISYAKGHEEGHEQACIENARNLLGLLPDEVIAERIGLPIAEVQKLHHA